jgi:hypothetical protein
MTAMTNIERNFLEQGGAIWCMRAVQPSGWEIYKQTWEGEEVFDVRPQTRHQAEQWIFLLADLSGPAARVAVHHTVPRPIGHPPTFFPVLV